MNTPRCIRPFCVLALFLTLVFPGCHYYAAVEEEHHYAVEINGTLCGYSTLNRSMKVIDDRQLEVLDQEVFVMLSALGMEFNTEIRMAHHVDPATGRVVYQESEIKQGPVEVRTTVRVEGDTAHFSSTLSSEDKTVELPPDVILENPLYLTHLKRDFVDGDATEKTYPVFDLREGEVHRTQYTKAGTERLELATGSFDAVYLDQLDLDTGVKMRVWIDAATAQVVKIHVMNRTIYLSDASVTRKIDAANLDPSIVSRVDVSIADFQAISYMKVRAKIEPTGLWVDPESLNVPGQRFTGTVEENLVEGVFEIEHRRYDGSNPPPFPPDFSGDEALKPYLEPSNLIESDDPVLRKKALKITEGATDSWDATRRIAEWVAENIDYAIPGGGTARGAFDIRAGECGAHSNLVAAFCRSVGIPARVVWGCMYIPNYGGAFGQHGWNEAYMGESGWVPLDSTVYEADYVDSGHIRIGVHESLATALNPIELEVLDYKVASASDTPDDALRDEYAPFLGSYTGPRDKAVELRVQDGSLVVDIPGQVALPLNDPDEDGSWQCKITDRVFVDFETDDSDEVAEMRIHELVRMNRTSDPDEIDDEVPEELVPYLGSYLLAPLNAEFTVRYVDGGLAVDDPLENATVRLQAPDERGGWLDEYGKNTIYFDTEDDGKVISLTVDAVARFRKEGTD